MLKLEDIMTRISRFCVMSGTLAIVALSANAVRAENLSIHSTTVTPKVSVHTPTPKSTGGNLNSFTGGTTHTFTGGTTQTFVQSPRDASTGLATGKRMHRPITITRQTNPSSQKLFDAPWKSEELVPAVKN